MTSSSRPCRVAIFANPRAGSGTSRQLVEALVRQLHWRHIDPVVCWRREELSELVGKDREGLRCVVAAGGDGTVREVLNRVPGVPVVTLPLGTENLTARHCGIGRCPATVAEVVASGRLCRCDVARANDRIFCLMASAGFDADVVHRMHARRHGPISRLSYAVPVLLSATKYRFPAIDVEIEDTGERLRGSLVFVFNLPHYGLGLPIAAGARADDGLLDLYVFERPGLMSLLGYLLSVLRGRHGQRSDVYHRRIRAVRLSSAAPVPLQIDGDPAGTLPVRIEVVPQALALLVPARGAAGRR